MKQRGQHDGISWTSVPSGLVVVDESTNVVRSRVGPVTNTFAKILFEDERICLRGHLSVTKAKTIAYSLTPKRSCRIHDVVTCAAIFFNIDAVNEDPTVLVEDSFCRLHGFKADDTMNYAFSLKVK